MLVITNMYPSPRNPGWGAFVDSQVTSLSKQGAKVRTIARRSRNHWSYVSFYSRALFTLLFRDYELVHAHYGFHSALPAMLLPGCKVVTTFHRGDALVEPRRGWIFRALQTWCVRRSVKLVAVSREIRDALIADLGAEPAKITVLPCGVNTRHFSPPSGTLARALSSERPVVIWSGSPSSSDRKGLPVVLGVAARLPDVSFVFIGIDPLEHPANCDSRGRVENSDIPPMLNRGDLFLFPTQSEGTPVAVLEAMASGLLVLASPVGGIVDLVTDGETGFLLQSRDPVAVAEQVQSILGLPDSEKRRIAANARELVSTHYSLECVAQRLMSVYDSACGNG